MTIVYRVVDEYDNTIKGTFENMHDAYRAMSHFAKVFGGAYHIETVKAGGKNNG